jgi:hypothetical protein
LGYSFSEEWTVQHHTGFMSLTAPHLDALWGITFSPFRGLFLLSPFLLYAVFGLGLWARSRIRRTEFWVVLLGVGTTFLFNISSIMWWGGFAVGPRYILPAVPFLILPASYVFQRYRGRTALRWVSLFLCIGSLAATWGLTLAGQSFPTDALQNPLVQVAWPDWAAGNIARNAGTLLGLRGVDSLFPLLILVILVELGGWVVNRRLSSAVLALPKAPLEMGRTQ